MEQSKELIRRYERYSQDCFDLTKSWIWDSHPQNRSNLWIHISAGVLSTGRTQVCKNPIHFRRKQLVLEVLFLQTIKVLLTKNGANILFFELSTPVAPVQRMHFLGLIQFPELLLYLDYCRPYRALFRFWPEYLPQELMESENPIENVVPHPSSINLGQ